MIKKLLVILFVALALVSARASFAHADDPCPQGQTCDPAPSNGGGDITY